MRNSALLELIVGILRSLKEEQEMKMGLREAQSSNAELDYMITQYEKVRMQLVQGNIPTKEMRRNFCLNRLVLETWPEGTKIGAAIAEFENYYMAL